MKEKDIIAKLNWFYSLEQNQVDLYTAQSKQADDIYLSKLLERAAAIEQGHVENIAAQIIKLGGKPIKIGDVIAPILGRTGGNITSWLGVIPMLTANILLEQKAISDYKSFLFQAGNNKELFDLLWANLIDEDLHITWMMRKKQELEKIKKRLH